MKPSNKDLPAYAAYLVRNIHQTAIRIEVEKTLEQAERGFHKSLYGLDYYLKKELERKRIKL